MAQTIACPNCKRTLEVPDEYLGQLVQCPDCNHQFTATASSITAQPTAPSAVSSTPKREAVDEEEEERPRRRRYKDDLDDDDDDDDDLRVSRRRYRDGDVPNYLSQSIIVTLFCCWPFGIAAIVNAAKVNTLLASGDYEGAVEASAAAKKWCWISFLLGLITTPVVIALQLMAEGHRF